MNGDWNYITIIPDLGEDWYNLKFKQELVSGNYKYSVLINDIEMHSVTNETPKVFTNVQAEFGRIRDFAGCWLADGSYRNLKVKSE